MFSFGSLAEYGVYRSRFGVDREFVAADRIRDESGCVSRLQAAGVSTDVGAVVKGIAIVAWIVSMLLLASWSYTDGALVVAAGATIVLGLLIGRWWLLLVPAVLGLYLAVGTALAGSAADDADGTSPLLWATGILLTAGVIIALLALGVALHRLLLRYRDAI